MSGRVEADAGLALLSAIRGLDSTLQNHITEMRKLSRPAANGNTAPLKVRSNTQDDGEYHEKVTVHIRVVFLKVGEIDTIKENFSANVFVQAKWREPRLDNYPPDRVDDIDWSKFWSPRLYLENALNDPKEALWHTVTFNDQGHATVFEKRRVKGSFQENMELKEFPFDTQDLTVTVASELMEDSIQLEEDRSESSSVNQQSFVDEQEWRLHGHVDVIKQTLTSEFDNIRRKPVIKSSCKAQRRPGFFLWNILLVMLFICSLSFATFAVSIAKPQNRLQLSFTLVLTTIAFKFVASQSLPKISYLTYLDKYILTSMGILCSICVWHAIIPVIMFSNPSGRTNHTLSAASLVGGDPSAVHPDDLQLAMTLDKYIVIILGTLYALFHVVFFLIIFVQSHRRHSRYALKDVEHQARLSGSGDGRHQSSPSGSLSKSKIDPY